MKAGNGTFNDKGYITVGDGGTGALTIQDQGLVETGNFQLGSTYQSGQTGGVGTLHLNGGTLSAPAVQNDIGTTGNLYFNGGTLQATASSTDFISSSGTLKAYVQAGGAVIDSNGYNITVNQPLLHDASGPALDGGLTKAGRRHPDAGYIAGLHRPHHHQPRHATNAIDNTAGQFYRKRHRGPWLPRFLHWNVSERRLDDQPAWALLGIRRRFTSTAPEPIPAICYTSRRDSAPAGPGTFWPWFNSPTPTP